MKRIGSFFTLMILGSILAVISLMLFKGECPAQAQAKSGESLRVIMIGAHPDDCEIKGGGTGALWAEAGAKVQFVAVANGDAGHQSQGGGALARRRAAESRRSAEILGISWRTLDFHDGEIVPTLEMRSAVIRAIREWQADIVITHRPNDYHPDHRYTSQIVQDAAYIVAVPNVLPDTPRLEKNPVFLYFYDSFKKPISFSPDVAVVVDQVMEKKWRSIDCMESQMYEWGPWIDGVPAPPQGKAERFEWLKGSWKGMLGWKSKCYDVLVERYGKALADKAQYVETFELCEYGRQPSRAELWEMFPK